MGLVTVNAFTAANSLIVPISCDAYAAEGLLQLLEMADIVRNGLNPLLTFHGMVITRFHTRRTLDRIVECDLRERFGPMVFAARVRDNATIVQAPVLSSISEEEYAVMERRQSERRFFMTGRRRNGDERELVTKNDIRTCMLLDKEQYDKIREIALRETMTIKDLTHMMFQLAIEQYEKRHGVVVPRGETPTRKDIF